MGNQNSAAGGGPRDRHKSGDSLPPSSPMGVKEGQAFSFDKRPSVGSHPVTTSHAQPIRGPSNHAKIILQHSHEDDEPYFTQPKSVPTNKHIFVSSVIVFLLIYFIFFYFLVYLYAKFTVNYKFGEGNFDVILFCLNKASKLYGMAIGYASA